MTEILKPKQKACAEQIFLLLKVYLGNFQKPHKSRQKTY